MSSAAAVPVVVDCDPGVDDAVALLLALASPELDVRLVTVCGGNVGLGRTLANARAVVGLAGRGGDVPVVAGSDRPFTGGPYGGAPHVHGADGIGGVVLPDGPPAAPGVAADAIRAALRDAPAGGLTLIGLGPATNLALALATEPALASRVREIALMTGAVGEGNWSPSAEFNAAMDPEALACLLALGCPVSLTTLDLTADAVATPERLDALRAAGPGGACVRAACEIVASVAPSARGRRQAGPLLHDPCAVALVLDPTLADWREVAVRAEGGDGPGRGRTHVDRLGRSGAAPNARLAERLDADRFFALLAERLARLP